MLLIRDIRFHCCLSIYPQWMKSKSITIFEIVWHKGLVSITFAMFNTNPTLLFQLNTWLFQLNTYIIKKKFNCMDKRRQYTWFDSLWWHFFQLSLLKTSVCTSQRCLHLSTGTIAHSYLANMSEFCEVMSPFTSTFFSEKILKAFIFNRIRICTCSRKKQYRVLSSVIPKK